MQPDFLFVLAIVIMSVIIHELSHGYMAAYLGDRTAEYAGRLTLNPVHHIDPVGSVIVPVVMYLSTGLVFGWAKPVPYNPMNLRNPRIGTVLVAISGAASNFLIALIFGIVIRTGVAESVSPAFLEISALIVAINLVLGVFNLIPVPPLDGSKVLFALLPFGFRHVQNVLERYWIVLIVLLILFGGSIIFPILNASFSLFTGMPLAEIF